MQGKRPGCTVPAACLAASNVAVFEHFDPGERIEGRQP
jgi:hypothetical protein